MRMIALILAMGISFSLHASDLTDVFKKYYNSEKRLSYSDLEKLKGNEVVLVPGILAEVLVEEDRTVQAEFSRLTTEYFSTQLNYFRELGVKASRLTTSTYSVEKTRQNIQLTMDRIIQEGKRVLFITHSLGGLVLLDYLMENPHHKEHFLGIIFLQAPFYGAPIADVFLSNPYRIKDILGPIMPFFNFSYETIHYLSNVSRKKVMQENQERILEITSTVPMMTIAGIANMRPSIFKPAVEIIQHGCLINALGKCLIPKIYYGPYDQSDGMVPVTSSQLPGVNSIVLEGVDHGEMMVNLPFNDYERKKLTEAFMLVFFDKILDQATKRSTL